MSYLRKITHVYLLVILFIMLSGCANIFSSRYQKVTISSATPGAKVSPPTEGVSKKSSQKFDKMRIFHTVTIRKEGYKKSNYAFELKKRSPTMAFTALNLLVPLYGWTYGFYFDVVSPKTKKFESKQLAPALVSYKPRSIDEKYMIINNTSFDTKKEDFIWHQYLSIKSFNRNKVKDSKTVRRANKSREKEDIKINNTVFTDALNQSLKNMNFMDTTSTIFPAITNTLYLNATVKKIVIHNIESKLSRRATSASLSQLPNELLAIELDIQWDVLDFYKQKVYSTETQLKSDFFTYNFRSSKYTFQNFINQSLEDNLESSLLKIRDELQSKGLLKMGGNGSDSLATFPIPKPQPAENSRINDFIKSVAIIKVDEGHGSGFVVSADGYMVTAYHVVAGTKKIEVVFADGTKADAELVRKNEEADLALIKVAKNDLKPLQISNSNDPEMGVDVWAIGAPKSVELGQSVSKGVLSSLRKANNVTYLQTDVSINSGNSGGPLIGKDGVVIGVVTSKLSGIGTEGIGFAVSSAEIFGKLKLQYK